VSIERFEVLGRVQGVGFRWYVRERARALGLAGSVRNRADGSVEVIARGEAAALDRLYDLLRQGPPGARVDDVIRQPLAPDRNAPHPFTIAR
jgi:acylphosphatase